MEIKAKKFSLEDIPIRVLWINNPIINKSMFFELPATVDKTERWCKSIQQNTTRVDFSFLDNKGEYLAMGGFTGISDEHKNGEFYVMVNPELQGKGIGKKVSQWMYNYAFSHLKLHKVFLYTNDDNVSAYRMYENCGFTLEGVLREQKWKDGVYQNRRLYGLLKTEWENLSWKKNINDEL